MQAGESPRRSNSVLSTLGRLAIVPSLASLLMLALPSPGHAGPCPGTMNFGTSSYGYRASVMSPAGPAFTLITMNACQTVSATNLGFGPPSLQPTKCRVATGVGGMGNIARWFAIWPDTTARLAAGSMAGCEFMCGPVTCRVDGATGLPVELLQFGVE